MPVLDGDDQHIAGADPVAQIQNDWGEFRNHGRAAVSKRRNETFYVAACSRGASSITVEVFRRQSYRWARQPGVGTPGAV